MSSSTSEKKSKKGIIALVVCGVIIVTLLVVVVVLAAKNSNLKKENGNNVESQSATEEPKRNVVVTPDNVDEVIKNMKEDEFVPVGSYNATMNSTWNFADGSSASSNAYVENSTSNTNDVYFDLMLADTSEIIYSSPVIPIGSHLENITLDKVLEAGSYDCVVKYVLVDENQKPLSSLKVAVKVIIEQ